MTVKSCNERTYRSLHFRASPHILSEKKSGTGMIKSDTNRLGRLVWSIPELLRGDFKQSEYGKVVLYIVILQRLGRVSVQSDCQELLRSADLTRSRRVAVQADERSDNRHVFF